MSRGNGLRLKLEKLKSKSISKMPEEIGKTLAEGMAKIAASGVAGRAKKKGDKAPDFSLASWKGGDVRLYDVLARGPVVLSFFRGGWCPYCALENRALQDALDDITALGATLVAISPQTIEHSRNTALGHEITFEVLSDPGNEVAGEYGLVFTVAGQIRRIYEEFGINLEESNGDGSWTLPVPATYVIGKEGAIRRAFVEADYTVRMEPRDIVEELEKLRDGRRPDV